MMNQKILIVDDDLSIQSAIKFALKNETYQLQFAASPDEAFELISKNFLPDLLLLDLHFPKGSGVDLLKTLSDQDMHIPCLLISGAATAKEAVAGIKLGAFDYIEKPISSDRLRLSIQSCLKHHHQWLILNALTSQSLESHSIVGNSQSLTEVRSAIARYAPTNARVLITGETGTGKEVIAQAIIRNSLRAQKPFLLINSAAIPESLIESELFGHRKGAFTGAISDRIGKVEMAHNGSLFLDEIGDLSLAAQAKLLRFLETGEIQRVGDSQTKTVDVRVIAATSKNLEKMVATGAFRADLFYRLNVARIHLAPLRERPLDIFPLFEYFVRKFQSKAETHHQEPIRLSSEALQKMETYPWPGNIRELRSFAERCCLEGIQSIDVSTMPALLNSPTFTNQTSEALEADSLTLDSVKPLKAYKQQLEMAYIQKVLKLCEGNISRTAGKLEIDRSYLHQKLKDWKELQ